MTSAGSRVGHRARCSGAEALSGVNCLWGQGVRVGRGMWRAMAKVRTGQIALPREAFRRVVTLGNVTVERGPIPGGGAPDDDKKMAERLGSGVGGGHCRTLLCAY